ncbi:MAG: hypothetical protein IPL97_13285 [Niastella sp.]|nr:hypothetical protein [Niastella sp.]
MPFLQPLLKTTCLLLFTQICFAQVKTNAKKNVKASTPVVKVTACPDAFHYHTNNLGNGKKKFPLSLNFLISKDSVLISRNKPDSTLERFQSYAILEKDCSDYNAKKIKYHLSFVQYKQTKYAWLYLDPNAGKITISFTPDMEPRIYDIDKTLAVP